MDLDYFHLLIFAIPFAVAYFFKAWIKEKSYIDYLIPSYIFFAMGLRALFHSIPQIFLSDELAAIFNLPQNPFIRELGFANLGMGLTALAAVFYLHSKVLFFSALPYALYLSFSAIGHLYEFNDFNAYAVLDWMIVDLITPLVFFILYFTRYRYE